MKTHRTLCVSLVLEALLVSSPAVAQISKPAATCLDTIANHGSNFLRQLSAASAKCEVLRVKGKLAQFGSDGQWVNCSTVLVGYTAEESTWVPFEEKVNALRAKYLPKFSDACPTTEIIAESGLDTPCGVHDGMTQGTELAACIIYDGHGLISANLQTLVGKFNAGNFTCKKRLSKLLGSYAKEYLSESRSCGQAFADGGDCDASAAMLRLVDSEARIKARIVAACGKLPFGSLTFGWNCQGPFVEASSAADCLIAKARNFIDRASDIVYDLEF